MLIANHHVRVEEDCDRQGTNRGRLVDHQQHLPVLAERAQGPMQLGLDVGQRRSTSTPQLSKHTKYL